LAAPLAAAGLITALAPWATGAGPSQPPPGQRLVVFEWFSKDG
jgi:hypothetical protein